MAAATHGCMLEPSLTSIVDPESERLCGLAAKAVLQSGTCEDRKLALCGHSWHGCRVIAGLKRATERFSEFCSALLAGSSLKR